MKNLKHKMISHNNSWRSHILLFLFSSVIIVQCTSDNIEDNIRTDSMPELNNNYNDTSFSAQSAPTLVTVSDFEKALPKYFKSGDVVALMLDFDGTLAAITPHPDQTKLIQNTGEVLHRLSGQPNVFTAIITGRGISDVKPRVNISNAVYAGNHGLDIIFLDGSNYSYPIPDELKRNFPIMVEHLKRELEGDGCWIENKLQSLTVHYREAPEDKHKEIFEKGSEIVKHYGYIPNAAKMAIEAKPPVHWNKGKAALKILETTFGKNWDQHVKPIFAGDDTTDEDGMRELHGKAISFRVTNDPETKTYASFRLPDTESIHQMLKWVETYYH